MVKSKKAGIGERFRRRCEGRSKASNAKGGLQGDFTNDTNWHLYSKFGNFTIYTDKNGNFKTTRNQ